MAYHSYEPARTKGQKLSTLLVVVALAVPALLADRAAAAFPGRPGPIAFQSTRAGGLSIWLVNPTGGALRQFTPGDSGRSPRLRQHAPALSPGGRHLAYVGSQEVNGRSWHNLFVKAINVRALNDPGVRILRRPSPRPIESVAFLPGSRRLVFSAVPRGGGADFEIFTVRVGGGGLRQLTHNRVQDIEPTASRHGLIAFTQMLDRGRPPLALFGRSNIALIRLGWHSRRLLTHAAAGGGEDRSPSFAPQGNRIVHERSFRERSRPGRIMEADLRGKRPRTVFVGVSTGRRFDEPHNPAFSPSGRTIVFDRTLMDEWGQITNADLYAIGRDRRGLRSVAGLEGDYETEPDWGPQPRR